MRDWGLTEEQLQVEQALKAESLRRHLQFATQYDVEALSSRLHDVYQLEAHRRGDVRHDDDYATLSEDTKEWDRVLARWILRNFAPRFSPDEVPPAEQTL